MFLWQINCPVNDNRLRPLHPSRLFQRCDDVEFAAVRGEPVIRHDEDIHLHAVGAMEVKNASQLLVREVDSLDGLRCADSFFVGRMIRFGEPQDRDARVIFGYAQLEIGVRHPLHQRARGFGFRWFGTDNLTHVLSP